MKLKSLKFPMMASSIVLLAGTFLQTPAAHATIEQPQPIAISEQDSSAEPRVVGQVAIFFGGIVVAWLADGIISYTTGRAPAEWVKLGLTTIENKIKSTGKNSVQLNVSSNGQVSGCMAFPCAIQTSEPLYETLDLNELLEPTFQ